MYRNKSKLYFSEKSEPDTGRETEFGSAPVSDTQLKAVRPLTVNDREVSAAGFNVEDIFHQYHGLLMKYLRERIFEQSEAEDIAQEIYYRIARIPNPEQIAYPKAFLMRTAKNYLIDMTRCGRKADIRTDMDVLEAEPDYRGETPESRALGIDMLDSLEKALSQLSPKCQAVFVMNRIDGISIRQIAVQLNLSKSMIEKYMRQALKHLKVEMKVHYDEG